MIPEYVGTALALLRGAGFEAYPVGGCVRDLLRGEEPHDWDVTTSAQPPEIKAVFRDFTTVDTGIRHGTVTVLLGGRPLEITTFRTDGGYLDHRHPTSVTFVSDLTEDLRRRDFTVNAMALGEGGTVIDPFGGQADLRASVLRAVGDPRMRFEEDALRILRAIRFCAKMGFDIEPETMRAMEEKASLLAQVSGERIFGELQGIVMGDHALKALLTCAVPLSAALPEIKDSIGFDQRNRHHIYDVWEHTARAFQSAPKDRLIRLALLFHDVGKPRSFTVDFNGEGHFYAHARLSAESTEAALTRLKADRETREEVVWLVRMHDLTVTPDERTAKRLLSRYGHERTRRLLLLKEADNLAQSPAYTNRGEDARALLALTEQLERQRPCLTLRDLAVRGGDLMALGYSGPALGETLRRLLEDVLEGRCPNERAALLDRVKFYSAQ